MIDIDIPDFGAFSLKHLVLDYNGTLALDGHLLPGVREVLGSLAPLLDIHVVTADTFGLAGKYLASLPLTLTVLPVDSQAEAKARFVENLGASSVVAIGNGRNDRQMLSAAAIGILLVQKEGTAAAALPSADILSTNILDALELLRHPKRMIATLRS
ncbi:MAG: hypothetical protein QM627_13090 [Luteolibacter sp.]